MSNGEQKPGERPEDWQRFGEQLAQGFMKVVPWGKGGETIARAMKMADGDATAAAMLVAAELAGKLVSAIITAEEKADPAFARMASLAVSDLLGVKVDAAAFNPRSGAAAKAATARSAADVVLRTMGSEGGSVEPSLEPAQKYLTGMLGFAFEGWLEGWMFELLSSVIPQVGQIETFSELDDTLARVMGFERLSRRVLSPIVDASIVTPTEWHVNKKYRHKLLGAGEVARQVARGRMTREAAFEELARQGYSDERIEALLNAATKNLSASDLDLLVRLGEWSKAEAVQHLRDQGWEEPLADTVFTLERMQRIAAFERQLAGAAIDAYADGRISRSDLVGWLDGNTIDNQEQAQLAEIADARRALRARPLSSSEARACVRVKILSPIDYRRALEREGRTPDAVDALDLLLRHELSELRAIDELRDEQARERDAEQAARVADRAAARQAAADARALARRGREADLERAVVRGRIPIARYVEVISRQFDADAVAIMVADVEEQREQFLRDEQRRDEAERRAQRKQLDVGAVRAAVLQGVLTLDEFRRHPALQPLDAGDVDILARTLEAELHDRQVADERRREAETRSRSRGIDLGRYALLVRRGIRSIEDYRARVAELFDSPADVDAVVELLELDLAADAGERAAREAGEAAARAKGLSLEQTRRAVLAGDVSIAEFEQLLIGERFTVDAQRVLMAGLQRELAEVEAARARQEQTDTSAGALELPLSELSRAARLGIISPSEYRARLVERGLDELDAEVSVEMLLREVSATQTARALRDQVEREPGGVGLSLAELRAAVKAGIKSLDEYRAALITAGKTRDAVETLAALLEDEVAERKAAESRRRRIAERLDRVGLNLDALEAEVLAGGISLDEYSGTLAAAGVLPAEVGILVGLLVARLEAAATPEG